MNLLIDPRKGYKAVEDDDIVYGINGQMTVFPLCCSTGVLKNLGATPLDEKCMGQYESTLVFAGDDAIERIKSAEYIHEIVEYAKKLSRPVFYPRIVADWYALSLCLLKVEEGTDTGGVGGYSNYKAAQITIADRLNAEKRSGKRFNSYNITYSNDHFMEFMEGTGKTLKLGEWLASTPREGAHGSAVRVGIFTPNPDKLRSYHDANIESVRDHVLGMVELYKDGETSEAADDVAALF